MVELAPLAALGWTATAAAATTTAEEFSQQPPHPIAPRDEISRSGKSLTPMVKGVEIW